eukprot:Rhum_TRINITY_DN14558_c12_g1::Rhum_TRINITY_DN14558_c12_g1_i1::g.101673::m.101673
MSCLRIALLVAAVAAASTYAEEDGLEWHVYASVLDANDTDAPELETDAPSWNETDAPAGTPDVPTATVPVAPETDAPSWNETDAPAGTPDVPTATVPVVPETDAPDANSTVVLPCRNDKECRQGGDDTAACTTAGCVCAAGFSQPRFHLEDAVIDRCYPDNTDTANATLETFFTLRFDAGKYDSLTEELRTKFKSILTTAFKRAPDTVLFLKGSIVVAGRVFVPLVSVIALEDAAATVKTELENEGSALLAVFGTNFVTDIVTSNNCITPGVHTALLVEGKCIVTDCMNGFALSPTNSSVCVVLPPTPPPSNDDGLGGGAVAGIIIGASVFVAVAAAVALFCVRKHRSASPVMEGEAAEELRVPAQHYANPLPPPGQPLPLPNQ